MNSLSYARERARRANQVGLNAVLFAMPTTPGEASLPYVEKEIEEVESLLMKASINTMVQMNPIKEDAIATLHTHSIVHFACHGHSESDPSQSCLLLQDCPLTVTDLVSLNIESAKFAYLSACHTSAMRNIELLDESINLSAAIQLSGYPSVVGSLWQVRDTSSAEIARGVYEWILKGDRKFDAERSAEGLHKAVCQLRESTRIIKKHDPLTWAPFIHVGI